MRRKIVRYIVCWLLSAGGAIPVFAQAHFYTLVNEQHVRLNQTFQVQYVVEGAKTIQQFHVPKFPGFILEDVFDIANAPHKNPTTGQLVNTYYKIVVLTPQQTGRLVIPGASALIDGKTAYSNTNKVYVQQSGLSAYPQPNQYDRGVQVEDESELAPGEDIDKKISKNFFLKVDVSKTSCYVGELLQATYKAYSRLNSTSQVVKRPSFNGFSVIEMVDAYDNRPDIEKENGRLFYTHLLRKVQLFPLQPGTYELDPAEIESVVHLMKIENQPDDNFSNPKTLLDKSITPAATTRTPVNKNVDLSSTPVPITVKPLPSENQPANFNGAVGQFSIATHLETTTLGKGDPGKLQVVIKGSGNIPLVTAPIINWPGAVKDISEPTASENFNKYVFPLAGTKTFEYVFSVSDTGNYVIPPVSFSFFDPDQKKYKTVQSAPLPLQVTARLQGSPYHGIHQNGDSDTGSSGLATHWYFFAAIAVIIIGWVVYQIMQLRDARVKENKMPAPEEPSPSVKMFPPPDKLMFARLALKEGNSQQFYREIERVLWEEIARKCEIPPSQLNKKNAFALLQEQGLAENSIRDISAILDTCEWTLYTPATDEKDMELILRRAETGIEALRKK